MRGSTSRRAVLCAVAALPTFAASAIGARGHDDNFLALAPKLVPLLDEYDRLWEASRGTYEPGSEEVNRLMRRGLSYDEAQSSSPAWRDYLLARAPADRVNIIIDEMIDPFWDHSCKTVPALILKARIAATFDNWEGDVFDDVRAMSKAGTLFA